VSRRLWPLARIGGRRDALLTRLIGELGESRSREAALRAREGVLLERLNWYRACRGTEPPPDLRLVKR
jgi:hypothetical protein